MYTIAEFTSLHHPSMNVDGDVVFFYEIYVRLHRLAEQYAVGFDEQFILSLLLYTEKIPLPSGLTVFTNTGTAAWAMSCSAGAKAWTWVRMPLHKWTVSCQKLCQEPAAVPSGNG